jgi:hypothetical protein
MAMILVLDIQVRSLDAINLSITPLLAFVFFLAVFGGVDEFRVLRPTTEHKGVIVRVPADRDSHLRYFQLKVQSRGEIVDSPPVISY